MDQAPTATRLFVLRHAKSSWEHPGLEDHERPLAPRGLRASEALAEWLRREDIRPQLMLCSSARRARQTLERVVSVTPGEIRRIERELYAATASELIERLRRVPPGTSSVMLVGHNPALQTLVATLARPSDARGPEEDRLTALEEKFPTGALATLSFTCAWARLERGCAQLTGFVRPRDLG